MFRLVQAAVLLVVSGYSASAQQGTPSAPLSALDLAFIDRVTWGVNESAAAEFQALGRDRWLDRQLHPDQKERLPPDAEARIAAMWITDTPMAEMVNAIWTRQRALDQMPDSESKKDTGRLLDQARRRPLQEAISRQLLRDLYSDDQLLEKMTWFWTNHFNVVWIKTDVMHTIGDFQETLRRHAFGRFRDLLGAAATHPAMLRYLDNVANAKGHINENYAREIMELHTMGVGSGYTQQDVQELARILTGVGIFYPTWHEPDKAVIAKLSAMRGFVQRGLFQFNPDRHDYMGKRFLGHVIDRSGLDEFEQALDLMAAHPATARHISRKLATFFVSDAPPEVLVQRMAQTFKTTDGDIASVLLVMFNSPEFEASLRAKAKFKDPMQFVLSALRLGYDRQVVLNTGPIEGWIGRLGEGMYWRETPDGYPLTAENWNASGQMFVRFEVARQLLSNPQVLFKSTGADAVERVATPQIQTALYVSAIQPTLSASTRAALDQAKSPQEWNALFLSSPEFMHY